MAKEKELTKKEIDESRKFERECWEELKHSIEKSIGQCPHNDCHHCDDLKVDLDVIGDMIKYMTEPDDSEPKKKMVNGKTS